MMTRSVIPMCHDCSMTLCHIALVAAQRVSVARASSFTTSDSVALSHRMSATSKLVHQTSSVLPRSSKMSSADCVYQRSPSIVPTTLKGLSCVHLIPSVSFPLTFGSAPKDTKSKILDQVSWSTIKSVSN